MIKNKDIIENSYYAILYFNNQGTEMTNLKLQKIMYLTEAYYMNLSDDNTDLFDTEWSAWNYGPVSIELYDYFKKFSNLPIVLDDNQISLAEDFPDENKHLIEEIYLIFGSLSAFELVTLTHLENSPWHKIKYNNNAEYDMDILNDNIIISKEETKEWFKETFPFVLKNTDVK